ncbi:MAG: hypothetical protein RL328_1164 [Acidobacteriota bacterium]
MVFSEKSMRGAILVLVMAAVGWFAVDLFEPGLRCLYFCSPGDASDVARRVGSVGVVLATSGAWGAFWARLTRGHAVYLPLVSMLLAGAALLAITPPSPRVFGAIGGVAATGFSIVRWDLLGSGLSSGAGSGDAEGDE